MVRTGTALSAIAIAFAATATTVEAKDLEVKDLLLTSDTEALSDDFKVYRGADGVYVSVVYLKAKPARALIQVKGVRGDTAGLTMLHYVREGRSTRFSTLIEGRGKTTLQKARSRWSSHPVITLYVPGQRAGVQVFYCQKTTAKHKAADLLSEHRAKVKDGTLKKLHSFDRQTAQAEVEAAIGKTAQETTTACGKKLQVTVDWTGISDTQIKELSLSSYLGRPLEALTKIARDPELKAAIGAKVKAVKVRFGLRLKVELQADGTLVYTAAVKGSNQDAFTYHCVMNLLS